MREAFSNNLENKKYKTIPFRAKHKDSTEGLGSAALVNQDFSYIFWKPMCNPFVLGKKSFKNLCCSGFPVFYVENFSNFVMAFPCSQLAS